MDFKILVKKQKLFLITNPIYNDLHKGQTNKDYFTCRVASLLKNISFSNVKEKYFKILCLKLNFR